MSGGDRVRILVNVCKRVYREVESYVEEVEVQSDRIAQMRQSGADESEIRKQEEVREESLVVKEDCLNRLWRAFEDLKQYLELNPGHVEAEKELHGLENKAQRWKR